MNYDEILASKNARKSLKHIEIVCKLKVVMPVAARPYSPYEKTKELIIYVAGKLAGQQNFGATLLNKALYFIDNIHYLKTGHAISEFTYIKQDFGPTPVSSQFLQVRSELEKVGDIEIVEAEYFGRVQKRLLPKREARLDIFSAIEIGLVDHVLSQIRDWTATEASEISHNYPAWQSASNKEILPLYTFLISSKEPTEADIKWAQSQLDGLPGC